MLIVSSGRQPGHLRKWCKGIYNEECCINVMIMQTLCNEEPTVFADGNFCVLLLFHVVWYHTERTPQNLDHQLPSASHTLHFSRN